MRIFRKNIDETARSYLLSDKSYSAAQADGSNATNATRAAPPPASLLQAQSVHWAANKSFKILKFNFKFPRARTFELFRARSRLYRSQMLQVNTLWKALDEIYKIHMLLHRADLNISENFQSSNLFAFFGKILPTFC